MKAVCDKHGALLILDEVMSGMGRVGTLHAWQQEDVVPDIQTIGKGLGGGYAAVAGLLIKKRVVDVLEKGSGAFSHGQTYQGHPIACAAALEVQRIIREERLVDNVQQMGTLMGELLQEKLASHQNVGNIRGRGLFWGVSFDAAKLVYS
jgi:adenosylmethionine-8-amino-7-oxononanoate aminotransferase